MKIRVGVILANSTRTKAKIEAREFEIDKNWEAIHPSDIIPLLNRGESIHGYCPIKEVSNEQE